MAVKPKPPKQLTAQELALKVGAPNRFKIIDPVSGELIWQANEGMQNELFRLTNPQVKNHLNEVLIGGPRGPGKTAAGLVWMVLPVSNPLYRGLILRQTNEELKETIDKAKPLFEKFGGVAKDRPTTFEFPSGAKIYTGYLSDEKSYKQFRGHEYHRVLIDEACEISQESIYLMILGSNRSSVPGLSPQILLTANPDGPGNAWLKARFVKMIDDSTGEPVLPGIGLIDRITGRRRAYIPGDPKQNVQLIANDPHYWDQFNDPSFPEYRRRAWLYGDWDAAAGAFYPQFRPRKLSNEPPEAMHVVPAHTIPAWCHRWISMDWGYGHHSAIYWFARSTDKRVHVYRELVVRGMGSDQIGAEIARLSYEELEGSQDHNLTVYLSVDAFSTRDANNSVAQQIGYGIDTILGPGSSFLVDFLPHERQLALKGDPESKRKAAQMVMDRQKNSKRERSIAVRRCNPDRLAGWSQIRNMLRWEPLHAKAVPNEDHAQYLLKTKGELALRDYLAMFTRQKEEILPMLQIHDCCPVLIDTIPRLFPDPARPDDVLKFDSDEKMVGDDPADSLRFGCMAWRDHEQKVPFHVWVPEEVNRIAGEQGISDINLKIQIARRQGERYHEQFGSTGGGMRLSRDSMAARDMANAPRS